MPQPRSSESDIDSLTDRELIARFATSRSEAAFRRLVERHSALVWGICRRMLNCYQDREDVFQATFLRLLLHHDRINWRESAGAWLYKVTHRLAQTTLARRTKRRESAMGEEPWIETCPLDAIQQQDARLALQNAILRLPRLEQEAIIICYLENRSRIEASREIGCSLQALDSRLQRGRRKLVFHLSRHGIAFPLVILTFEQIAESAHDHLIQQTLQLGMPHLTGDGPVAMPSRLEHLSQGAFTSMFQSHLMTTSLATLSCYLVFLLGGVSWLHAGLFSPAQATTQIATTFICQNPKAQVSLIAIPGQQASPSTTGTAVPSEVLNQFVQDGSLPDKVVLPGWDAFAAAAGNDKDSRAFYQEMYAQNQELLDAYQTDLNAAQKLLKAQLQAPGESTLPKAASLFLVAADKGVSLGDEDYFQILQQGATLMFSDTGFYFVPRKFEADPIFRKLTSRWVVKSIDSLEGNRTQVVLAVTLKLKAGVQTARELLKEAEAQKDIRLKTYWRHGFEDNNYVKLLSMSAIGLLGDRNDMPFVEPYLKDATSWGGRSESIGFLQGPGNPQRRRPDYNNGILEIQARDAALAAMVLLSGQKLEDYRLASDTIGTVEAFFFDHTKDRKRAFKKWKAWVKKNPIKEADPPANVKG